MGCGASKNDSRDTSVSKRKHDSDEAEVEASRIISAVGSGANINDKKPELIENDEHLFSVAPHLFTVIPPNALQHQQQQQQQQGDRSRSSNSSSHLRADTDSSSTTTPSTRSSLQSKSTSSGNMMPMEHPPHASFPIPCILVPPSASAMAISDGSPLEQQRSNTEVQIETVHYHGRTSSSSSGGPPQGVMASALSFESQSLGGAGSDDANQSQSYLSAGGGSSTTGRDWSGVRESPLANWFNSPDGAQGDGNEDSCNSQTQFDVSQSRLSVSASRQSEETASQSEYFMADLHGSLSHSARSDAGRQRQAMLLCMSAHGRGLGVISPSAAPNLPDDMSTNVGDDMDEQERLLMLEDD